MQTAILVGHLASHSPTDTDLFIMFLKGHRMSEVVLVNQGSPNSRWRCSQVGGLLLTAVVSALFCLSAVAQVGSAIETDQKVTLVNGQVNNAQATDQTSMSAEQIIDILRQQPALLASAKATAAQQSGADPSTISDSALYSLIQQDAGLRAQVTKYLNNLGYSTNAGLENKNPVEATDATQTRRPATTQPGPYVEPNEPQVIRQSDPYGNLPSLLDLYAQLPPATGGLRRFGSDTFLLGTGNANELPIDIPAGPEYVLGPGDNLIVNMWGGQSSRLDRTIDRQGQISLPE